MKLGADNKKQIYVLGAMGALALLLLVRTVFSGDDSGPTPVTPSSPSAALAGASATSNAAGSQTTAPSLPVATTGKGKKLRLIPNARGAVIERTGHLGSITRPEAFAAIVRAFTEDHRHAAA